MDRNLTTNKFVVFRRYLCIAALAVYSQTTLAMSGAAVEFGYGQGAEMLQISNTWDWDGQWSVLRNWTATGLWEAEVGRWHSENNGEGNIWETGLTPVLRLSSNVNTSFWEGGIGVHAMSNNHISERNLGTHFIFGTHVGLGWKFHGKYELGFRFQHFSNANTASHNAAINYTQMRFGINY